MSRIKSDVISLEYAEEVILKPGESMSGQEYGGSRSFTTAAEDIIDAASPTIRAYGNSQGSLNFAVCLDFESEPDAVREAVIRLRHLEENQKGTLRMNVGGIVQSWDAGILSADWKTSYTVDSVRLVFSYNFVLGALSLTLPQN